MSSSTWSFPSTGSAPSSGAAPAPNGSSSARSPTAPSSLHESLGSLSINGIKSPTGASSNAPGSGSGNGNASASASAVEDAISPRVRPLSIRTPSGNIASANNTSASASGASSSFTERYSAGAIGSGRTGSSPPSRAVFSPDIGPGLSNGAAGPTHTASHQLPWPTSAASAPSNATPTSQSGNGANGSSAPQSAQAREYQHNLRDGPPGESSAHEDLPGLSGHASHHRNHSQHHHDDASAGRFALSQPQFNLDHAQLAKSREQRDLDDVDSGQRASATLWMGDLEGWMDESYIRRCISALGWDRDENGAQSVQTNVKMIKGASTTSGYCFITFPTSAHAQSVLSHFGKQPPMLMPGSERTFKLNWATGLPGVQPKWEGEWSVFVGDLGREVTEGELVALFTPLFPSTKSAKIMYDPSTGMSRGYGFVRFGDENDMTRSLALGQNTSGSGLSLRGRTLRISEASGSGGSRNRTTSTETSNGGSGIAGSGAGINSFLDDGARPGGAGGSKNPRELHINVPGSGSGSGSGLGPGASSNLLSPNATGFSIPVATPGSPGSSLRSPGGYGPSGMSMLGGAGYPQHGQFGFGSPGMGLGQGSLPGHGHLGHGPGPGPGTGPFGHGMGMGVGGPSQPGTPLSPSQDPHNTTVFVGGLPACINEDTLKSFFQHFGDITYVKIPPNKGCGFVQFVRRQDAELAIAKMHDFPIHGKSRIRLSWGRSQGDKQVEHVRKLAGALNVPFEAVWRMVQGQDNSTIKQIASAVGGQGPGSRRPDTDAARADLARLAGIGAFPGNGSNGPLPGGPGLGGMVSPTGAAAAPGPHDPETYAFRPAVPSALSPAEFGWAGPPRDNGPYSRVSPSAFAPMSTSSLGGHAPQTVPLSPPPSAGVYGGAAGSMHPVQQGMASFGSAYTSYTPLQLGGNGSPTNGEPSGSGNGAKSAISGGSSGPFEGSRAWRAQSSGLAGQSAHSEAY